MWCLRIIGIAFFRDSHKVWKGTSTKKDTHKTFANVCYYTHFRHILGVCIEQIFENEIGLRTFVIHPRSDIPRNLKWLWQGS